MSGSGALLVLLAFSALWPFGRDKRTDDGTLKGLESVEVRIDTTARLEGGEAKAIEHYRAFLDLAADDPRLRAEAMRRLADLQLESTEALQLQANVEALGREFASTIDLYEALLAVYPDYAKNDLVLYQLARAYDVAGESERALATLDRLIAMHPNTPYYEEAQFRRGETLFVERRYADAEAAYAQVLARGPDSAFHEQALYKHGWSAFKQLEHDASLASFFALLDNQLGADPAGDPAARYAALGRADQELVEDTLRVLSISFSYMDGPESITERFRAQGPPPYAYIVYGNLGDLYLDKERFQDAADTYAAFVALDPYHAKAPLLQGQVIEAVKQGGFVDLVLVAKQEFVERYGPGSPYWERFSHAEQPEAVALLKSNVTDLAAYHHAEAQQSGAAEEYAAAARWYRTYLQSFPEDAEAPRTNFLLAEVLFESGDFGDAALEYERTAYAHLPHDHAAEAGYAALLAYARHEEALAGDARADWHRRGIDSALRFASVYPGHEEAAVVATDAAERLFALAEFERARDVATAAALRPDGMTPALQRTAWTVIAHSEFDLANYAAAEAAYVELLARVPADDPARGELDERVASAIYKQGEQARDAGVSEAAVQHFLRVGSAVPDSAIRATAEYDAAAALIQARDWARAAAVLEGFRARFPGHALAEDATANLAVAYLETGEWSRAAQELDRIAEGSASDAVKQEALWRAAELYSEAGQTAAAAGALERYVERYPRPAGEAIEARHRLSELAERRADHAGRAKWLGELVAADARAGAERTDRTRYLAAHAALELAKPARDAFRGTRLVAPLDASLRAKRAQMEQALAAYTRAADYGVAAVTTAANYEIADLYHGLSRDLLASERPRELSAAELEQYHILLEEQAFPFEEEAIALHERNAARTVEGIYDEWVERSIVALGELMPVRYAKREIDALEAPLVALSATLPFGPEAQPAPRQERRRRSRDAEQASGPAVAAGQPPAAVLQAHERGLAALRAGRLVEAEIDIERFLVEHPGFASAHVNLALVYSRAGRSDEARAALEQALALDATHAVANNQLGIALRREGKFAESEAAYRRALETEPGYALAQHNLGVLLDLYLRRQAEALDYYEEYQSGLTEPNQIVARWIIDLRRRLGVSDAPQVARGEN